eukprot:m.112908 g.112908  ORF g.112908 m.112908 type:complete len:561 (+) comp14110_c0_seq3:40-1722(+)
MLLVLAALLVTTSTQEGNKPNFIILFGDDIGNGDLGAFGHQTSRTPNLDKMAATGAKLTQYLSGANVCSPSRASIMTGRYFTRTGVWPGVFSPDSVGGLPLTEITLATALKNVGYTSGAIGKWHLGVGEYLPTNHGFDYYYGAPMTQNECVSNIKYPGSAQYSPSATDSLENENVESMRFGPCPILNGSNGAVTVQHSLLDKPQTLYDMLNVDDKYDQAAADFIKGAVSKNVAFFLYFCSHHTHAPQFAPDSFLGYSRRGLHGDSLGLIDRSAGRLMLLLEELGIENNTLMVFSADNGGSLQWRELGGVNGNLRCGKGTTYEGGHRVPLIARWPGRIPADTVVEELTSSLDWFPTMVNLAGGSIPTDRVIDGVDIQGVLFHGSPSNRTDFIYFDSGSPARIMAVRVGKWKLHMFTHGSHCSPPFPDSNCYDKQYKTKSDYGGQPLLINLEEDPGEAQLQTSVCNPDGSVIDPRCHLQQEVDEIVANLTAFYNKYVNDTSLWATSQIDRGSNLTRFPCCSPQCTPRPYCCSCDHNNSEGPAAPTQEQHITGIQDNLQFRQT